MAIRNLHGGDIYKACKEVGLNREELLDFSANINPLGLSPRLRTLLVDSIDSLVSYPDPECMELREELATYLGVDRDTVIAGNGASEVIYLLFEVLKPRRVLMPAPCFAEYAGAAAAAGTQVQYYELRELDGFRLDVEGFLAQMTGEIDAVLLCNPNNPTSVLVPKMDLMKILEVAAQKNIPVIVDEAFIELTVGGNDNSMTEFLPRFPKLFIIRALTKIMAIPGLRLGYAAGDPSVIAAMQEKKLPWSVNAFACSIGRLLNEDGEYFDKTAKWLAEEKKYLYEELSRILPLKVYPPDTNFILIKLPAGGPNSAELKGQMLKKGILIRDADNFKYLDNRFIRVAVKDRTSNIRLIQGLNSFFSI